MMQLNINEEWQWFTIDECGVERLWKEEPAYDLHEFKWYATMTHMTSHIVLTDLFKIPVQWVKISPRRRIWKCDSTGNWIYWGENSNYG